MSETKQKIFRPKKFSCFREARDFFGPPPILSTENPQDYYALGQAVWKAKSPKDFIEISWVNDVTYQLWEVLRLRRIKVHLIDVGRLNAVKELINQLTGNTHSQEFWKKWAARDEESIKTVNADLERVGLTDEAITAKAMEKIVNVLDNFERQCSQLETRRLITNRESVQYRTNIELRRERKARHRRLGGAGSDPLLIEKARILELDPQSDDPSEEVA